MTATETDAFERTPRGAIRARGAGIPLRGMPGPCNAITDVDGVSVGYCTLIEGEGQLVVGRGPVRTGVTAILPRPREELTTPVFAGCHSLNGNGELTGTIWIDEAGRCDGPITITNTHSCGVARDASIKWMVNLNGGLGQWALPVAGETFDGILNDINGFHVFLAFSTANPGAHTHRTELATASFVPDVRLDPFFEAVIQAVDEAVLNALFANEAMTGVNGRRVEALPHGRVADILTRHGVELGGRR